MEVDRSYYGKTKDTRVQRKTIGQAIPLYPGMMYPNENYFALVPNTVPENIRDGFLMKCARKRELAELKKNPEQMMNRVAQGVDFLKKRGAGHMTHKGKDSQGKAWFIKDAHDLEYARSVFSDLYDLTDAYAARNPQAIVEPYKVKMFNRLLEELKLTLTASDPIQQLELIPEPEEVADANGNMIITGLSYSDVMMLLTWYRNALKDE